ncbi:GNAT family N-acetyltransferase [Flavobacteriaceae bacterium M23B6Z8]
MNLQLHTPRLTLRPFMLEDGRDLFEMNSDLEVIRYTGDSPFVSLDEAIELIKNYDQYKKYRTGRLAVVRKEDNQFLGWCGLKYHDVEEIVDIGYRFYRKFWGFGYATEAARASLKYGFQGLQLTTIFAHVHEKNRASEKVLEKCGLRFVKNITYHQQPAKLFAIHKKDFNMHTNEYYDQKK